MDISVILVLILCGFISNMLSAIFGIGGGVVLVPLLLTVFPFFSMQMIAATSLSIVIISALINLSFFIRQKIKISYKNLIIWSLGMIISVQLGFELSFYMTDFIIISVFAVTMLVLSAKTFLSFLKLNKQASKQITPKEQKYCLKDTITGFAFCSIGGFLAGFTGIGGGSIMAPLINQLKSVNYKQVPVYTNYMMVLGGLGSMYGYLSKSTENPLANTLQIGYINLNIITIVAISSFLTSFISMKLRGILKARTCALILTMMLLSIAIYSVYIRIFS